MATKEKTELEKKRKAYVNKVNKLLREGEELGLSAFAIISGDLRMKGEKADLKHVHLKVMEACLDFLNLQLVNCNMRVVPVLLALLATYMDQDKEYVEDTTVYPLSRCLIREIAEYWTHDAKDAETRRVMKKIAKLSCKGPRGK